MRSDLPLDAPLGSSYDVTVHACIMAALFPANACRPELVPSVRNAIPCRGTWKSRVPIVYCEEYNIRVFGLEKLHPMDACKFGKIAGLLESAGLCQRSDLPSPVYATDEMLRDVHTEEHLNKLHKSKLYICQVVELPLALIVPRFLLQRCLMDPIRYHLGGTVLAMGLAIERGWAINLGGGAHHARNNHSEGWCFYADITVGIRKIRSATNQKIQNVLYIDGDVHQGNGVEHDKRTFKDDHLFIVDIYNAGIFPGDFVAKSAIDIAVELRSGVGNVEYLDKLKTALNTARQRFQPDLVVYNAGTDILKGDPLGRLNVTSDAVIQRDEMVFQHAADAKAPIVMLLSGGYCRDTHRVIADSILNLTKTFHLV